MSFFWCKEQITIGKALFPHYQRSLVFHEDILCQGIFFEWLETLTYLMTKTLQCLSAHESPSDEAK